MSELKVSRFKFKEGVFGKDELQELSWGVGMEFARIFKAENQPFIAEKKYADAAVRSTEYFELVEDLILSEENSPAFDKKELEILAKDKGIENPKEFNKLPLINAILGIAQQTVLPVGNPDAVPPLPPELPDTNVAEVTDVSANSDISDVADSEATTSNSSVTVPETVTETAPKKAVKEANKEAK